MTSMRDHHRRSLDSPIRIPGIPRAVPELPDVEAFRHVLTEHAVGQPIQRVDVIDTRVLHGASAQHWQKLLRGRCFGEPLRRGVWLVVPLADAEPIVLLYFGRTGSLNWVDGHPGRHRHDRIVFVFSQGELRYQDMR
jgi:formamidopyrimidine-DNA glycosylase